MEFREDVSTSEWKKIIRSSENAYFYHTPMWADILDQTYGYENATRLYYFNDVKVLVPLLKIKWHGLYQYHSTPMGYGGIFSESEISSEIIQKIFNDLKQSMGMRSLLGIFFFDPFFNKPLSTDSYVISAATDLNYTHILPLKGGFEVLWNSRFTKKNRNMIRNAEKKNVEIFKGATISDFESYYQIYLDSVNRWKTENHHPFKLYEEFLKYKKNVKVWLARAEGEIIGGIITMEYGKNIISFGGASLSNFWGYSPNNLLYRHAIEYACDKGFEYFDFGQSGDLSGVRKFKESFGAEKINLKKYVILSPLGKLGNIFFKKYRE